MKICTAKTEVLHLSRNPHQCVLQVNGATLKQVEKFKYLGVTFMSDGRQDEELDTQISKASAVMQALPFSALFCCHETRKNYQFSKQFLSPFLLIHGHESWVITERVRSQVQASEMRFLKKLH